MKLDIYQKTGKKLSKKIELNDEIFGIKPNEHCVYLAVSSEMAAIRQGTHSSKTKAEVSGSGAKPWRQKGTGRARVGTIRNPSRVHGSKAFGPKPHSYSKKINKKVRQLARKSVLSQKVLDKTIIVIDSIALDSPKTKEFSGIIKNLNLSGKKITILTDIVEENLFLSSRNIKNVCVIPAESASTYDLMDCQVLLVNEPGINILNNQLS
jgi:large subunit ribosomal protein L4